uniref:Peptidase S1 domain-containing protein n=1 Tax=Heliothis virescens TaxID=7102 RepID=A0A2A4IUR8_HELVI
MTNYILLLATFILLLSPVLSNSSKKEKTEDTSVKPHHTKHHTKSGNSSADEVEEIADESWNYENTTTVDARRILFSKRTEKGKRPYMVYLQLTKESAKAHKYRGWLCGGVIVDPYYVLTSAACVEDADRFYIVSGTTKFVDSFDYKNDECVCKHRRKVVWKCIPKTACVEDADRFYIVSGTTKFVDSFDYKNDECVCKHRRKVVWKCIPKNYKFDFQDSIKWSSNDIAIVKVDKAFKFGVQEKGCEFGTDLIMYNNISREMEKPGTKGWIAGWGSDYKFDFQDSIKWSSNDIAIVKVDKAFKFGVQEKGCEFGTDLIMYNNISREMEKPGTKGWIAGWGSGNNFREGVYRRQKEGTAHIPKNSKCLQEAKVCVMDNEQCAKKWAQRFREIITQYMICTKDVMKRLSEVCDKRYANCTDVESRRQTDVEVPTKTLNVDLGRHLRDPDDYTARRSSMQGGFCENDHGGPLIVRYQGKERVIGVISACKIDPKSHSCHGPFLYTSIYRNRQFISCAIHKDVEENCRRVFRSGITHEEWSVSWENVDDDDDDDMGDNRDDKPAGGDKSSDESATKEVLRELSDDKKKTEKKKDKAEKEAKEEADSGSEAEDVKATTEKPKKEEKKHDSEKSEKHKKKSKSKKHKSKTEEKVETSSQKAKSKESSEEIQVRGQLKPDPATYESSHDDNVNDPDNE